jgi:tRNA-binding EMAP/Myf-like protein
LRIAPVKPVVHLDILGKTDIRVGKIELVDGVPGSQKLVRLIMDLGDHKKGKRGPIVISMNGVDKLNLNANR